jgi:hypothetical protein
MKESGGHSGEGLSTDHSLLHSFLLSFLSSPHLLFVSLYYVHQHCSPVQSCHLCFFFYPSFHLLASFPALKIPTRVACESVIRLSSSYPRASADSCDISDLCRGSSVCSHTIHSHPCKLHNTNDDDIFLCQTGKERIEETRGEIPTSIGNFVTVE